MDARPGAPVEEAPQANPHNPDLPSIPYEPFPVEWLFEADQRYETVVEIDLSPEALFVVFDDPESWPRFVMGIGGVVWTSPMPVRPGTTRTVFFWGGMEVYEDFFVFDRPREMAFYFTGITQDIWSRFGEHYKVEELGGGRCRLTWTVGYRPTGVFRAIHWMVRPLMSLAFKSYMWRLARYCRRLG